MGVDIEISDLGGAAIRLEGQVLASKSVRLSINDRKTRSFLTPSGWSHTRKTLVEGKALEGAASFTLAPDAVALIKPGARLVFEDVFLGFRQEAVWPEAIQSPAPVALSTPEETLSMPDFEREIGQALVVDSGPAIPPASEVSPVAASMAVGTRNWWSLAGAAAGGLFLGMIVVWPFSRGDAVKPSEGIGMAVATVAPASEELKARISDLESRLAVAQEAARARVAPSASGSSPALSASADPGATIISDALRAQVGDLTTKVATLVSQRDDLRNTMLDLRRQLSQVTNRTPSETRDLLLKLDAANADRTRLSAKLAELQDQAAAQPQIASLTDQLSKMTADRDEMIHRNDELRDMNLELKGQIAKQDMARVDLDKQLQDLQSKVASLTSNGTDDQSAYELPVVRPMPSGARGVYGAFATAGNGVVILSERGFATPQDASADVMTTCANFSAGTRCEVAKVFHNTCAAVARVIPTSTQSRYALEFGTTPDDAHDMALSECYQRTGKPCDVTRLVCVQ
ncbi:DUF4189 domain-containing protein [Mesorhizobium sp. B2-4-13]|uniref:DUF4189 domain-containing protein n=1 Tax=Mesorhizobium sp. B2-4-13 TaxID=2589936 RepID=UPI001150CB49|nr:DUF4189 domain-containing protein [Mesorhizobium sp. B2-4-13]TPK79026.1 DUF4189 domain-containing protein [Mesorhizobium sp. B2-4-13]